MSTAATPVSDMLVTVKSRELQRALLAEMQGDRAAAGRHFLASAHLELVLAHDYAQSGDAELALRSGLSAASCFWRAGDAARARHLLDNLANEKPDRAEEVRRVLAELEASCPALAS